MNNILECTLGYHDYEPWKGSVHKLKYRATNSGCDYEHCVFRTCKICHKQQSERCLQWTTVFSSNNWAYNEARRRNRNVK